MNTPRHIPFPHPGETLIEEFLAPLSISRESLSKKTGVPLDQIQKLIDGHLPITQKLDFCLSEVLGTSQGFWLSLQKAYDDRLA
tara:strand:- start:14679 stop:14930 length:252 start_codon:yes stop_codon:yes gene_type:complete